MKARPRIACIDVNLLSIESRAAWERSRPPARREWRDETHSQHRPRLSGDMEISCVEPFQRQSRATARRTQIKSQQAL